MFNELFRAIDQEARARRERLEERRRAARAYHEAHDLAFIDYLATVAARSYPTFGRHHARSRTRHGVTP